MDITTSFHLVITSYNYLIITDVKSHGHSIFLMNQYLLNVSVETIKTCGTGNCDGIASLEIDFDIADDIIYIPNWINCEGELLQQLKMTL